MKRIRLGNTVFEGRNNVYLLEGRETVLIDAGVGVEAAKGDLAAGLADAGLTFADVDEVFVTHWHWDHSGLAGDIQAESGATVRVHEADAGMVARDEEELQRERLLMQEKLDDWNLPDEPRHELENFLRGHEELRQRRPDVTRFEGGDTFDVNGHELEVVHLPGHAAGLCAFEMPREGERQAFVGDVILPKYTPNVGGADVRVESPLRQYIDSLREVIDRDWDRAWPGHRDPIDDPAGRARDIIQHHRERTEKVVAVLARHGACDAWTVSAHLFGDLSTIHILHGPGEAWAHLDHLEAHGVVERDGIDYRLAEPDAEPGDVLDPEVLFPGG